MSAIVICQQCGAKIRAGRERCPRCRETLTGTETLAPAPRFDMNRVAPFAFGALAVAVLVTGFALWRQASDTAETPVEAAAVAPPAAVAASSVTAAAAPARAAGPAPTPFLDARYAGGVAYTGGDYERARALYRDAVQRNPRDAESWSNLGQVLVRLNQRAEAVGAFRRAIALNGDRWAYHFNLARVLMLLERWDESVASYQQAQRLYPDDYAIAFNLGLALRKKGEEAAAAQQFQRAIELDPQDPTFHMALAISHDKLGRKEDALAEYRKTLELAPEAPEVPQIRARIDALLK